MKFNRGDRGLGRNWQARQQGGLGKPEGRGRRAVGAEDVLHPAPWEKVWAANSAA